MKVPISIDATIIPEHTGHIKLIQYYEDRIGERRLSGLNLYGGQILHEGEDYFVDSGSLILVKDNVILIADDGNRIKLKANECLYSLYQVGVEGNFYQLFKKQPFKIVDEYLANTIPLVDDELRKKYNRKTREEKREIKEKAIKERRERQIKQEKQRKEFFTIHLDKPINFGKHKGRTGRQLLGLTDGRNYLYWAKKQDGIYISKELNSEL